MPVDSDAFKEAMARFVGGVTVVTTQHEADNTPIGVTATAFCSLSAEPPLVLICIANGLFTHQCITDSGIYAVNFLKADQMEWGKLFAGMIPGTEDRFADVDYLTAETGAPILPDTLGWVDCRVKAAHEGGDHTIFVGEVVSAHAADGAPLAYYNRQWVHTTPLKG